MKNINKTYVINLEDCTERRELTQKEADKIGLEIEFFPAVDGRKVPNVLGEMLSTYKAHNQSVINVLEQAIIDDHDIVMVCEDDVMFDSEAVEKYNKVFEKRNEKIIKVPVEAPILDEDENETGETYTSYTEEIEMIADIPDNWNVLYLGMLSSTASPKVINNLHRVSRGVYLHCVVFNMTDKVFIQSYINELNKMRIPADLCLAVCYQDFENTFAGAILPSIAKQRTGYSTILQSDTSKKRFS
jgi:GR25 family glycosyltransferase involved in LPS biosynthesis